ncbi:MAG: YbdK family carboxylate-amine ligase, partial [Verrucomicrobia bacterium]|nr:YbdK family carboxylate-amine ligase [Verrucomicrobiota bacterium]
DHVKAEVHQSMLEIDTKISTDVMECRECIETTLSGLFEITDELGLVISTSGTHPFQRWPERLIFPSPRYTMLQKKYRWLVKRMNVYGLHVHLGVESADEAMQLMRSMYRFLPHLMALSANSPFWGGENTGMQACRPSIMESFPTGGLPPYLESWDELERYCTVMEKSSAIRSLKDLYWYVRPNIEFGTIEFRVCDALSSIDEIIALVALMQNLIVMSKQNPTKWQWDQTQQWIAPTNHWIASRDGLAAIISNGTEPRQISEELNNLVDELQETALQTNSVQELNYIKKFIKMGSGSSRQLACFRETNDLTKVVKMCANELRRSCRKQEPALL